LRAPVSRSAYPSSLRLADPYPRPGRVQAPFHWLLPLPVARGHLLSPLERPRRAGRRLPSTFLSSLRARGLPSRQRNPAGASYRAQQGPQRHHGSTTRRRPATGAGHCAQAVRRPAGPASSCRPRPPLRSARRPWGLSGRCRRCRTQTAASLPGLHLRGPGRPRLCLDRRPPGRACGAGRRLHRRRARGGGRTLPQTPRALRPLSPRAARGTTAPTAGVRTCRAFSVTPCHTLIPRASAEIGPLASSRALPRPGNAAARPTDLRRRTSCPGRATTRAARRGTRSTMAPRAPACASPPRLGDDVRIQKWHRSPHDAGREQLRRRRSGPRGRSLRRGGPRRQPSRRDALPRRRQSASAL